MDILIILLIACGLAVDSFAVSVSAGIAKRKIMQKFAIKIALLFGFAQFLMPVLGWWLGQSVEIYITMFDHWIAAFLLFYVGGKMIISASEHEKRQSFGNKDLIILSIATSIDAFAVGISFGLLNVEILIPAIIIGTVTFMLSYAGVAIGKSMKHINTKYIIIAGGLVLFAIGIKILVEHLLL